MLSAGATPMTECRFKWEMDVVMNSWEEMLPLLIIALNWEQNLPMPPNQIFQMSVKRGGKIKDC